MRYQEILLSLLRLQRSDQALRRASRDRSAIRALQILLYKLGFAEELNWNRFKADGDYGSGTINAVRGYMQRNGLAGGGDFVDGNLLNSMMWRQAAIPQLLQLQQAIASNAVEQSYKLYGGNRSAGDGLRTLMINLGYNVPPPGPPDTTLGYTQGTADALRSFAQREGIAADGTVLLRPLAIRVFDRMSGLLGPSWFVASGAMAAGQRTSAEVVEQSEGSLFVSDEYFRLRLPVYLKGTSIPGGERAEIFIPQVSDQLHQQGLTDSAIRVMIPVSENEGALDAVNTGDNAFLSFGMYQWTMGTEDGKGELPALLKKIKQTDPAIYQEYYGRYGMEPLDAETDQVYGLVAFNGRRIFNKSDKEQFRAPQWAFRFWKSGMDPVVKMVQVSHALSRIFSFYQHPNYKVGGNYFLNQLISSEYGIALILDHHVNRPAHPRLHLAEAMVATGLDRTNPALWGTQEESMLISAYLDIRSRSNMTEPVKRAQVTWKYVQAGQLSAERGSFQTGMGGVRSRSADAAPASAFPEGLSETDYPVIQTRPHSSRPL